MAAPIGPEKIHRYTADFRVQAVRLSLRPEVQTQDVVHALDIHRFMLSRVSRDVERKKDPRGSFSECLECRLICGCHLCGPGCRELRRLHHSSSGQRG